MKSLFAWRVENTQWSPSWQEREGGDVERGEEEDALRHAFTYRLVLPNSISQRTSSTKFKSFSVLSEAPVRIQSLTCWIFL